MHPGICHKDNKVKIAKVWVEHVPDNDPDLSYIGEFSNTAGEHAIEHSMTYCNIGNREYRYFNPANAEHEKQAQEDYERMKAYGNDWHMIGIRAHAELNIPHGSSWIIQKISSPGLWGIESDVSYFTEVENEELATLRDMLSQLGIELETIDKAFENVEHK